MFREMYVGVPITSIGFTNGRETLLIDIMNVLAATLGDRYATKFRICQCSEVTRKAAAAGII